MKKRWNSIGGVFEMGVGFALGSIMLYCCAKVANAFAGGRTLLEWATTKGMQLIKIPGSRYLKYDVGEVMSWNVSAKTKLFYQFGTMVVLAFVLGLIVGALCIVFRKPLARFLAQSEPSQGDQPAAPQETKTSRQAIYCLMLALVGTIGFGFLVGFVAFIVGMLARRELAANPRLKGSFLIWAGQVIAALSIAGWLVFMVAPDPFVKDKDSRGALQEQGPMPEDDQGPMPEDDEGPMPEPDEGPGTSE